MFKILPTIVTPSPLYFSHSSTVQYMAALEIRSTAVGHVNLTIFLHVGMPSRNYFVFLSSKTLLSYSFFVKKNKKKQESLYVLILKQIF